SVPYFCKNRCRRADGCRWICRVGLYYVWPEGLYDNWSPRIEVQGSDGAGYGDPRAEADLSCEEGVGTGCPCWLFPRTDPLSACDARRVVSDAPEDSLLGDPVQMLPAPVPMPSPEPVPMLPGRGRGTPR